jgi:type II secretion system (T2SS) protein M
VDIKLGSIAHRYIALAMLLMAIYILSTLFLFLLNQASDAKQRYGDAQLQLQKYQIIAADLPQAEADNQALLALVDTDDRYIVATSPSLAVARLQKNLQQIIQQSGASLISMQAINTEAKSGFLPVKMQLHLRLTNEAMIKLLYQLESQKPTGFVNELQIQRQAGVSRNHQSLGDALLDLRFKYTVFLVKTNDS